MAKFNEYPAKTIPKDADKFMLYSAEDSANKLIDYDKLADAVLDKLTSKQFALDQGTKTLLSALNELNSNRLYSNDITYASVIIPKEGYVLLNSLQEGVPEELKLKYALIATYLSISPASSFNVYINTISKKAYVFGTPNTEIKKLTIRYLYNK